MTYGITKLTPARIAMLRRLDDGPAVDSIGLEFSDLSGHEYQAVDYLVDRGLVAFSAGWRMTFWIRLTPLGRELLQSINSRRA